MAPVDTIESLPGDQIADVAERLATAEDLTSAPPLTSEELARLTTIRQEELTPKDTMLLSQLVAWIGANHDALFAEFPGPAPPFDHLRDFWRNFYEGPVDEEPAPPQMHALPTRFLDFELGFPFGVPACALTPHSAFVDYFARRGFDLLTYKTVRDQPWNPHPFPQWGFAPEVTEPLSLENIHQALQGTLAPVHATLAPPESIEPRRISLVNSFGVPSLPVDQWMADVKNTKAQLSKGQALIVSVMGSPDSTTDRDTMVKQFAFAADKAREAGADIVEVNLSCPNTGGQGVLCRDAITSAEVVRAVHAKLTSSRTPLLIKISYLEDLLLNELIGACADYIDGVVAINTISVPVDVPTGESFFPGRPSGGLSGAGIRNAGLDMAQRLVRLRSDFEQDDAWVIVGVGGVVTPDDFGLYRDTGVNAVQSCSGAWMDPSLATAIRQSFGRRTNRATVAAVLEALASGGLSLLGSKRVAEAANPSWR